MVGFAPLSVPMRIPDEFEMEAARLFAQMDAAYDRTAAKAGFVCNGCKDNCCRTRFYHHTIIEYAYLTEGFKTLGPAKKNKVKKHKN